MLTVHSEVQNPTDLNPPSRAPVGLAINFVLAAIASLIVFCRILVKTKLKKLAIEDALIVFATVIIMALVVLTKFSVKWGFGLHIGDIRPEWFSEFTKYGYAETILGAIPYPVTKISMLFFYLRLSPQPTFRKICYATIGYITATFLVLELTNLFPCKPIRGAWDHSLELHAKCIDVSRYLFFYTSMNIVTDVLLMILPIPIILRLQLRPRAKYGLVAMFAFGISLTTVSSYSMYTMYKAYHSADPAWDGAYSWMWAMAEFCAGIIVACMPSMLLFAKWVRGDMTESKNTGSGSGRTPGQVRTFGSGGRPGASNAKGYSHTGAPTEMVTRTSIRMGSQEYIIHDSNGIVKSTEVVVVEMTVPPAGRGNDAGSMC